MLEDYSESDSNQKPFQINYHFFYNDSYLKVSDIIAYFNYRIQDFPGFQDTERKLLEETRDAIQDGLKQAQGHLILNEIESEGYLLKPEPKLEDKIPNTFINEIQNHTPSFYDIIIDEFNKNKFILSSNPDPMWNIKQDPVKDIKNALDNILDNIDGYTKGLLSIGFDEAKEDSDQKWNCTFKYTYDENGKLIKEERLDKEDEKDNQT